MKHRFPQLAAYTVLKRLGRIDFGRTAVAAWTSRAPRPVPALSLPGAIPTTLSTDRLWADRYPQPAISAAGSHTGSSRPIHSSNPTHNNRLIPNSNLTRSSEPPATASHIGQQPYPQQQQGYGQPQMQVQPLSAQQLEQLVAPIALYPDSLVAEVLAASTYPQQVAEADRWRQAQGYAPAEQIAAGAQAQNWDPSVKGLTAFPQVLAEMDRNARWTTDLGNAHYYNQPQDLMEAVQVMRQRAQAAGNLQDTPQETVSYDQGNVEIAPANPQVVYVPAYNPWGVYGQPVSPYPGFSLLGALGSFLGSTPVSFGLGIAMNAFSQTPFGLLGWGLSWLASAILFNHSNYYSHSTTVADWGFPHGGRRAFSQQAMSRQGSQVRKLWASRRLQHWVMVRDSAGRRDMPGIGSNRPRSRLRPASTSRRITTCSRHSIARPYARPGYGSSFSEGGAYSPRRFGGPTVVRNRPIAHPQPVFRTASLRSGRRGLLGAVTEAKALTDSLVSRSTPAAASICLAAGAVATHRRVSAAERASVEDTPAAEAVTGRANITIDPRAAQAHLEQR